MHGVMQKSLQIPQLKNATHVQELSMMRGRLRQVVVLVVSGLSSFCFD
jgi:hypothetical protein